ncbi:uncharacterized protein BDZ99DRAFT_519311 [Mytilinidion resinicola]|uniref:Uncharacterized protein n=1 Tax=Mytilinidion resinicola TaxID=574789 RepID=A0A6A6YNZ8_9PEZI|nr:uncharacterized protein BDZ99DRAFT_519311 [Mytilinidion resinicola]KAF2810616.1 hypothetical protein BDZ99DRAFT_519311 [Mytilinidion resinicola]
MRGPRISHLLYDILSTLRVAEIATSFSSAHGPHPPVQSLDSPSSYSVSPATASSHTLKPLSSLRRAIFPFFLTIAFAAAAAFPRDCPRAQPLGPAADSPPVETRRRPGLSQPPAR